MNPLCTVRHRRTRGFIRAAIAAVLLVNLFAAVILALLLRASLPRSAGAVTVHGISAEVSIELDHSAVPTIRGETIDDALLGQGFVHAQQRFFQMDLARRHAAGELAALVGPRALPGDSERRPLQLRTRARALVETLPAHQRAWIDAYTTGVNAGLTDLSARPPEYLLLNARPAPWTREDSVLVVYALYQILSMNHEFEAPQGVMQATLPDELYRFLTPSTTRYDTLLDGEPAQDYEPLPLPGPQVVDLRADPPLLPDRSIVDPPLYRAAGSNQWAVGSARGAAGHALLANDPHLTLQLPNVFHRAHLTWATGQAGGIGVPGVPGILIGANDALAWGATVSNADQSDWVVIEVDPDDPSHYLTPDGSEPFVERIDSIQVRGRPDEIVRLRSTRWGPVVGQDWLGRALALRATWLDLDGLSFDLLELPAARTLEDAIATLARWHGPSLNWMLAAVDGRIAWIMNGPLIQRIGHDGAAPRSWASGAHRWGPRTVPPAVIGDHNDVMVTANNRTRPVEQAASYSAAWMRPLRAARAAELLGRGGLHSETDFLAMQLDTRAAGFDPIAALLLEVVAADEQHTMLASARRQVERWNGRADTSQTAFRILHMYYRALLERTLAPLLAPAVAADPQFTYRWPLADEPLRRLLDERPMHLLDPEFDDWPTFLRAVLADALRESGIAPDVTWGEINRLTAAHPFASLLPFAGGRLSLPAEPMPGSMISLRVAAPAYGAAARFVIAPADPASAILQTPGGQGGHLLSRHLKDLHADWAVGTPTPFQPALPVRRYSLHPPSD